MSKHNAGLHYVHHNTYGKYEDLSYYNSHSEEGIKNRRNDAIAQMEEMGEFVFCKTLKSIRIYKRIDEEKTEGYGQRYRVLSFPQEEITTIRRHSHSIKLFSRKHSMELYCHDKFPIIYVCESDEDKMEFISKDSDLDYIMKGKQ